jgi:hypothetical protein
MGKLKIGDRVRIVGIPGEGIEGYYIHRDTKWVFKKLIERRRSLRISRIVDGFPWFSCKFFRRGRWEYHSIGLFPGEEYCWVKVKKRKKCKAATAVK